MFEQQQIEEQSDYYGLTPERFKELMDDAAVYQELLEEQERNQWGGNQ